MMQDTFLPLMILLKVIVVAYSIDLDSETRNILTVPIMTTEEFENIDELDICCPRAILQLINKKDDKKFTEDDVENL